MTIERLRTAYRATPFRPFTISLADGRKFKVNSPEFILVPPAAQRTFVVVEDEESYSIIDLLMVTSIDYGGPTSDARSNGHRKRR